MSKPVTGAPEALVQDFAVQAPGSWLLRHVPWTRAEHRISAVNADATQSSRLEVAEGAACLVVCGANLDPATLA